MREFYLHLELSPVWCNGEKETTERFRSAEGLGSYSQVPGPYSCDVQRWARAGMPMRREGRFTMANRGDLKKWIAKESDMPKPAHVLTGNAD
jgi:hypothetical protein